MLRTVGSHLVLNALAPAQLVLSVAIVDTTSATETLVVKQGENELAVREVLDQHGTRLHLVDVLAGPIDVTYNAQVRGTSLPAQSSQMDNIRYLRQSRYCESDMLAPTARSYFKGLAGGELVSAVVAWVKSEVRYVRGSSNSTDGALRTLVSRKGVCRDFAHLSIGLLRALDMPARFVSTYAPGLSPMDFHAVGEAFVGGEWHVIDATGLAPRQSLVRIATGRDAADVAFLTVIGGQVNFTSLEVTATSDEFVLDSQADMVQLR
jgi:transglutaminase-like putative cysteine protease